MMSKCKPEGLAGDNEVKGRDRHSRQRMSKTKHVKAQQKMGAELALQRAQQEWSTQVWNQGVELNLREKP